MVTIPVVMTATGRDRSMSYSKYLLALILTAASSAYGQQLPELLLPLTSAGEVRAHEERALAQLTKEEGATGSRLMMLNRAALPHLAAGTRMSVALGPNDTETVRIESAATDAAGIERVAGQMQGTDQTSFLMVVDKNGAAATVDLGERFFEITSVDANAVAVIAIDRSKLPDEEGDQQLEPAGPASIRAGARRQERKHLLPRTDRLYARGVAGCRQCRRHHRAGDPRRHADEYRVRTEWHQGTGDLRQHPARECRRKRHLSRTGSRRSSPVRMSSGFGRMQRPTSSRHSWPRWDRIHAA